MTKHIRLSSVSAFEMTDQSLVIKTQLGQHRGVQIMPMDFSQHSTRTQFVCRTDVLAAFDAASVRNAAGRHMRKHLAVDSLSTPCNSRVAAVSLSMRIKSEAAVCMRNVGS